MESQGGEGGAVDEVGEESEEFQLLVAYCDRRTWQRSSECDILTGVANHLAQLSDDLVTDGPKKQNVLQHASDDILTGVAYRLAQPIEYMDIHVDGPEEQNASALDGVADRLAQIADSAQISEEDLETDGLEDQDDVIEKLVELLKKSGDKLNEKIKKNTVLQQHLQTAFNYAVFERVTSTLQSLVGLDITDGSTVSKDRLQREQIAWAFEVTSRLSAVDIIPRRRALGFGERYVRLNHSAWVQQHGGWEKAFDSDDID
ncbi:uncharacterized protein ACJ7VT_007987 isoform 2-T2 [Polymixia lowei]